MLAMPSACMPGPAPCRVVINGASPRPPLLVIDYDGTGASPEVATEGNLAGLLCRLQPLTAAKFPLGPTRPRQPLDAQTREQHMSLGSRARSACSMPIRSRANPARTLTLW